MKNLRGVLLSILIFSLLISVFVSPVFAETIPTLDKILKNQKSISANGYVIEKVPGPQNEQWSAVLKKGDEVVMRFENGFMENMTLFGLYPFVVGKEKQLVVEQFSGGAHCCWTDWIIELSTPITILYDSQDYPVGYGLVIEDLDKDGTSEFIQELLTFDYFDRIPHAYSPLPAVVFRYDAETNTIVPANPRYADFLLKDIGEDIKNCEEFVSKVNPADYDDNTGEYLSSVLQVVIPYFYAGKETEAWSFFDQKYQLKDKEDIRSKIEAQLDKCAVYQYLKTHPTR
jgi:hypothetical protein